MTQALSITKVDVHLTDHVIPTTFIVFSKQCDVTLLGIDFITDAGLSLDIANRTSVSLIFLMFAMHYILRTVGHILRKDSRYLQ